MNYFYKGILNFNSISKKNEKSLQKEIENYFNKHLKKIRFTHKQLSSKGYKTGIPDGILYYKLKKCIFELKYTLAYGYDYKKQIIQAICYYLLDPSNKTIIIASEKYFDYLYINENIDIINKYKERLLIYLQDFSPRTIADNIVINEDFIIHKNKINKEINIKQIINNIFINGK